MGRRMVQVLGTMVVLGGLIGVASADDRAGLVQRSVFDLFKSTGLVGILLVLTSMVGTALLIQYLVNMNNVRIGNPTLLSEVASST